MWASIGAALWGLLEPYIMPILAAFAGDTYRKQLDQIKQLEAENAQKQAAVDMLKIDAGPIAGSADRLRVSPWNRKQQP